ncbi:hypothetical protein QF000_002651 [Paraburkholderia atlantica]|uniref:Uncharacterized protein n=1 Tax=Paraburkholderia atlantica TaxID=2654982 RepID=A0A6I1PV94_PARAM|nr:hypothetical protein [Paraburkholderia atlantica]MBB5425814.1 hypothetical protein [Paraburkholderia atlantica]MPW06869.1 hypothetical protein [Paraburkholderia atlantica]NUY32890.1 hypothetical protein [Paraburkholderia atlantica]
MRVVFGKTAIVPLISATRSHLSSACHSVVLSVLNKKQLRTICCADAPKVKSPAEAGRISI